MRYLAMTSSSAYIDDYHIVIMTMLPTSPNDEESEPLLISLMTVAHDEVDLAHLDFLGVTGSGSHTHRGSLLVNINERTTLAIMSETSVDNAILESSDGVFFLLDAVRGVSSAAIEIWQALADLEIPRHIIASNLFASHTDFDELVAISRRIFSPEVLVRYLPMADDDETKVVALFDLLENKIDDFSSGISRITIPDIEHLELTADQRDALIEALTYLALPDDALAMYRSGITPANTELIRAWSNSDLIAITPVDKQVGQGVLLDWINNLIPRWNPLVDSDDHDTHTSEPDFYGYGVASGVARIWGRIPANVEIKSADHDPEILLNPDVLIACLIAEQIQTGDVLAEPGVSVALMAPAFD